KAKNSPRNSSFPSPVIPAAPPLRNLANCTRVLCAASPIEIGSFPRQTPWRSSLARLSERLNSHLGGERFMLLAATHSSMPKLKTRILVVEDDATVRQTI